MSHLREHWPENGLLWLSASQLKRRRGGYMDFPPGLGGVSRGCLASLNLGTGRGDEIANVRENFRRFGDAVGFDSRKTVFSKQVHRDEIRVVTAEDCGKGLYREREYEADGLITNVPGVPLAVFSADCIPILLHDPVCRAVAGCHAGWRGTAMGIARKTVEEMIRQYGCCPRDIRAVIGTGHFPVLF